MTPPRPAQTELPSVLDGTGTWPDWTDRRRAEVMTLLSEQVYGPPPPTSSPRVSAAHELPDFVPGARSRWIEVELGAEDRRLDLLLVLPATSPRPAPLFLGLNFGGLHTTHPDPRLPLARGFVPPNVEPDGSPRATDRSRGNRAAHWPFERIVARGFGVATVYAGDIRPDLPDNGEGSLRGTLACWAWGLSRALDALLLQPEVDPRRVYAVGHSRMGKTALLAAARDPRFAGVAANQSGTGGAALARDNRRENIAAINRGFPHWFNSTFKGYSGREHALPLDQHFLLAALCPRPLLLTVAADDPYSDAHCEYRALKAAEPVYHLAGLPSALPDDPPAPGQRHGEHLACHLRAGGHSFEPRDWDVILDFFSSLPPPN